MSFSQSLEVMSSVKGKFINIGLLIRRKIILLSVFVNSMQC